MNGDTMSGKSLGGYQIVSSIDPVRRERSHAGNAYLGRAKGRPNLEIITNATVEKVIMTADAQPRASGIEFLRRGHRFCALSSKEVILCAGAFGSPCILQRSGIGGREVLGRLGIKVRVHNEEVGENLRDHIMAAVSFELMDGIDTTDNFRDPAYIGSAM